MRTRETDRRCVGSYAEYPGAYAWPEYEYRCPDCGCWSDGSDVTQSNADGTESVLCEACAGCWSDSVPYSVTTGRGQLVTCG
jgi:hypothetical protein